MSFERSISSVTATGFVNLGEALEWLAGERCRDIAARAGIEQSVAGTLAPGVLLMPADPNFPGSAKPWSSGDFVEEPLVEGRILYVEDNFRIAEITEMMLEDLGMTVTWAACAEDALKVIGDSIEPFDIVLTDIVMPGLSGVQLARRIGRHWPDVPVILTSGFSEELAQGYGSEYELLQKPFTRVALIECLQRYLGSGKN